MKWLKVVILSLLLVLLIPSPILADTSQDVTVTAAGWILAQPPTGLTLTYISDYEVGISWTKGVDADNTMIRGAVGRVPEDISDGYLVYNGSGTTTSDTGVSLDETATPVYYRAWSQDVHGSWESIGISDFIGGIGMTLLALFTFCGILSFLALRSSFGALKLLAGLSWFGMLAFWVTYPPAVITAGDAPHVAIILVLIGMGLMMSLMGLAKGISDTGGEPTAGKSTGSRFRIPDWIKDKNSAEAAQKRRSEDLVEYRNTVRKAARGGKTQRRR